MIFSSSLGVGGGIIALITALHPVLIFFVIFSGIGLGLLISNEVTGRRIQKRAPRSVPLTKVEEKPTDFDWLRNLAQEDIDNLSQRIKVEVRMLDFAGLNRLEPFFQLIVSVTNTTVFKVRLKNCDGNIQTSSGPLSLPPQVQEPLPSHLAHGESKKFTLHQSVTKDTAQWLTEQAHSNNPVNFVCILCRFVFDVVTTGYDREVPIILKDDGLPCLPEGTYIVPFIR